MRAAASDISLLKLCAESGIDEAYEGEPADYFAAGAGAAAQKFESEFAAEKSVSTEEAMAKAVAAATGAGSIGELGAAIRGFDLCPLKKFSTSTVSWTGIENPALLCVFEVPNPVEDRTGECAAGDTGELLKKILAAIGLSLGADAAAMPLCPWRPAGGRAPTREELAICAPFARRHIELAKPKTILALGSLAGSFLLGSDEPITQLRGNWGEYAGIPVMPTFSLPYLLANREAKKKTWEDVQAVAEKLRGL
jgi:DNA polymerase